MRDGQDQAADHRQPEVLDQGKRQRAALRFRPILGFQRLFEKFERRQLPRADAQRFQVQDLHAGHQRHACGDGAGQRSRAARSCAAPARSGPAEDPAACASALRRAPFRPCRFHDPCPPGAAGRAASGCAVRRRASGRSSAACAAARSSEIASSPPAAPRERETKERRWRNPCRETAGSARAVPRSSVIRQATLRPRATRAPRRSSKNRAADACGRRERGGCRNMQLG